MDVSHGIKGLFFDLDGVLCDAAQWHKEAFDLALGDFDCSPLSEAEHLTTFNGLSTYRKLELLCELGRFTRKDNAHRKFYERKQKYTIKLIEEKCKPIGRVIDVVDWASSLFNVAVVTNCSRVTADLMLRKTNLINHFSYSVTNNDVDGHIKPSPYPYTKALNHFRLGPKEALAIDDNQRGVASAYDATCRVWHLREFENLTIDNLKAQLEGLRITI